jgi:hypothetical protein
MIFPTAAQLILLAAPWPLHLVTDVGLHNRDCVSVAIASSTGSWRWHSSLVGATGKSLHCLQLAIIPLRLLAITVKRG